MKIIAKKLLRIAKKILSDVHFSTQQEFDEYLKNHPGYRENTRFFVNGVQVKAPPKQKKKKDNIHHVSPDELITNEELELLLKNFLENTQQKKKQSIFGDTEKIEKDLASDCERVVGHPIEKSDSMNAKYIFDHGDFESIFKPYSGYNPVASESFAYEFDKAIGLGMVPPTISSSRETKYGEKNGSEQFIVPDSFTWEEVCDYSILDEDFFTTPSDEFDKFKESMEKMAVFDYLTGNSDRHDGNFMLNENMEVFLIDNGLIRPDRDVRNLNSAACCILNVILQSEENIEKWFENNSISGMFDYKIYKTDEFIDMLKGSRGKKCSKGTINMIKNIDVDKIFSAAKKTRFGMSEETFKKICKRVEKLKGAFENE